MRRYLALVVASIGCGDNLHLTGSDGPGDAAGNPDAPRSADASADAPPDAPPDGPPDLGDGSTSGTRLKLVWYVTQDGVKSTMGDGPGFYDVQRGEDCRPFRWSDGNWYCAPGALQGFYSDATCTTVIGRWFTSTCAASPSPPLAYISDNAFDCTSSRAHLYQRGTRITPAQVYSRDSTGGCTHSFISSTDEYYAIGPEVATTDLVQMTPGAPEGTGTIQLEWWQTADGLRAIFRSFDSSLHDECVPWAAYSGAPACLPRSARSVMYGDASCTERELALATSCPAPPYSFAIDNVASCPKPTATFFTTGPAVTSTPLYWLDGSNTCDTSTPIAADTYYSVGAQITPTPLQYVTDTTPGRRLELHRFTATDFTYRDKYLYDTTVGSDCQLQPTGDGSAACFPFNRVEVSLWETETGVVDAFSDAACTMPITLVQVYNGDTTCDAITPPGFALRETTTNGCVAFEVHKTGTAYTAPVYGGTYSGGCYLWSDSRFAFYDGSTIIPNSSLATATRVVDP